MLAKITSKNQLTLPKNVVEQVRAEYYAVRTEGQSIVLTPVTLSTPGADLQAVQAKLAKLGIKEGDVADAVQWARRPAAAKRKATPRKTRG